MSKSRLTVGTSRIPAKPPRAAPPCTNPIVYGANTLSDPGVELQLANFSGGPLGDEIPMLNASNARPRIWSDGTAGPVTSPFTSAYIAPGATYDDYRWKVVSTSPRTGTYHIRQSIDDLLWGYGTSLYLSDVNLCDTTKIASAVVADGDYVRMSFWGKATPIGTGPRVFWSVYFYNSTGGYLDKAEPADYGYFTGSYQQFSIDGFAPAGSAYVLCFLALTASSTSYAEGVVAHDLDDFVLEVS